ncbi:hypothetical protein BTR23_18650 [Alkalihalophilus pseudofirmus]|nr:hypothetical protein BTR23_18650 [Alkalihalophilus pseudofirmus]
MTKTVMKKSLSLYLLSKGHELKECERNRRNTKLYVYKFIETPELIKDLTIYTIKQRLHFPIGYQY